jgi:hypothetical protein
VSRARRRGRPSRRAGHLAARGLRRVRIGRLAAVLCLRPALRESPPERGSPSACIASSVDGRLAESWRAPRRPAELQTLQLERLQATLRASTSGSRTTAARSTRRACDRTTSRLTSCTATACEGGGRRDDRGRRRPAGSDRALGGQGEADRRPARLAPATLSSGETPRAAARRPPSRFPRLPRGTSRSSGCRARRSARRTAPSRMA